jgi:ribonucleoside-diphosphate reductase beta chain
MSILDAGFNLTLRPSKYPQFHQQFRTAYENNNWTLQEISFNTDKADLRDRITHAERHVISRLLAFFATGDQIVSNNAALTLYKHVNSPEARMYYSRQMFEEALHIDFYKTLLEEYLPDEADQIAAFRAIENIPSIKQKGDFCFRWMEQMNSIEVLRTREDRQTFLMNLLTFACAVEGLFFFAAFAYVYYLRDRGLLHGLASGTNWVFRDESAHMRFAFSVIDVIRQETPELWDGMEMQVRDMLAEAIECEMQFAEDVLSMGVIGLSAKDMREYLRYVADGHCHRLGMAPIYGATCPFPFMLKQDVMEMTNFFERTVSSYSVGIGGEVLLDEEF